MHKMIVCPKDMLLLLICRNLKASIYALYPAMLKTENRTKIMSAIDPCSHY